MQVVDGFAVTSKVRGLIEKAGSNIGFTFQLNSGEQSMQGSTEKENGSGVKKSSCPNGQVVFLLLFIGFLVGLCVGFYTKDFTVRQYLKLMGSTEQGPLEREPNGKDPKDGKIAGETEEKPVDPAKIDPKTQEGEDDKKKEEEEKTDAVTPDAEKPATTDNSETP